MSKSKGINAYFKLIINAHGDIFLVMITKLNKMETIIHNFTGYMSNIKEAIFAMLAATSIGAIWSGPLPFYGARVSYSCKITRFKYTIKSINSIKIYFQLRF